MLLFPEHRGRCVLRRCLLRRLRCRFQQFCRLWGRRRLCHRPILRRHLWRRERLSEDLKSAEDPPSQGQEQGEKSDGRWTEIDDGREEGYLLSTRVQSRSNFIADLLATLAYTFLLSHRVTRCWQIGTWLRADEVVDDRSFAATREYQMRQFVSYTFDLTTSVPRKSTAFHHTIILTKRELSDGHRKSGAARILRR